MWRYLGHLGVFKREKLRLPEMMRLVTCHPNWQRKESP